MNKEKRTAKHEEARDSVSDELKPYFDQLVDDYTFAVQVRYGQKFVSYIVLADIINVGWRPTEVKQAK